MVGVRDQAPVWMGAGMVAVGALHFVATRTFTSVVPRALPARRELVLASGVVEVGLGAALMCRRTWAAYPAALTLLAVWPANIAMALDAGTGRLPKALDNKAMLWARVPLQLPMIWAALQARKVPR